MSFWRNTPHHLRTLYSGLVVGTAITLIMLLLIQGQSFIAKTELAAYDWHFQLRGDRPFPQNIVVVGIDASSLQDLANGGDRMPRREVAKAVDVLHRAGAKVIGLDFLYTAPSTYGARDDQALAAAIKRAGNVVLEDYFPGNLASNFVASQSSVSEPIPQLAASSAGIGIANVPVDQDGVNRTDDLLQPGPGGTQASPRMYPVFPLVVASLALHRSQSDIVRQMGASIRLNYNGHQDPGDASQTTFQFEQFESVATGQDSPGLFKGKIVLIIPASVVSKDLLRTPFGTMYGGFMQANALNTILRNDPIQAIGDGWNDAFLIILGLLTTIFASRFGIYRSAAAVLALAIGFIAFNILMFSAFRYWLNLITPEVTLILAFAAIMALRFATEERLKRRTGRIFGQYVKPEIVELLVSAPDEETALAGARRPISCLFVDIRGFTAMSERMEPEDVVDALDIYLEELTLSVEQHDGTVDKYVGDELMAIWNAPRFQEDHALLAVKCALDMVVRTEVINEQLRAKNLPMVRFGIGVNSGDAVVGQMGSSLRKQYDVIGDSVNTGARLCSAAGGSEVIIGQNTWEMIGNWLEVEETEPLRLKGKSQPLRTFRVINVRDAPHVVPEVMASPVAP